MTDQMLERSQDGSVVSLTLSDADRLNVLSERMLAALQDNLDDIAERPDIRCVVLKAEGRAFCAGHDLREMTQGRQSDDGGRNYFRSVFDRCAAMMMSITRLPQPVIAQVQGSAVAAGCQLVASCDLAIAAEGAKFGVNGVNIGLFCSTPMVALSRNLSRKHAFEMLTTGRLIGAEEALGMGLVNRVVPTEALQDSVDELAGTIASKLDVAVKIGKRAFYEQAEMRLSEAYAFTGDVMVENMMHSDTEEGISAFLEKRQPRWTA